MFVYVMRHGKAEAGDFDTDNMRNALNEAVSHLKFTLEMFRIQIQENKGFILFEHPWTAKSWETPTVIDMKRLHGVEIYRGHQCAYQTEVTVSGDKSGYIRKDTGWMTNCPEIGIALSKKCPGNHKHMTLEGGTSKISADYCKGICRAVLKGLAKAARKRCDDEVAAVLKTFIDKVERSDSEAERIALTCLECGICRSSDGR